MTRIADSLITEKMLKGIYLSGKQVAALSPKQHIFIDGRKAVVVSVDVDFKRKSAELVYVKGRKAFGKEQYLIVPFNDTKTTVQVAVSDEV